MITLLKHPAKLLRRSLLTIQPHVVGLGFTLVTLVFYFTVALLGDPGIIGGYSLFALIILLLLFNFRKRLSILPTHEVGLGFTLVTLVFYFTVALSAKYEKDHLGDPAIISGYSLFALIILLLLFNIRKRLSIIPIFSIKYWTLFHVIVGVACIAFYWLHTGSLWPQGLYEQLLAMTFYLVSVSGIVGFALQRVMPRRLTESGLEIIYERIPEEISNIRAHIDEIIIGCTKKTRADTLGRQYVDTLEWFFIRPRFLLNHIAGGKQGDRWIQHHFSGAHRYLNSLERECLDELYKLADKKNKIDFHYALQSLIKYWLFFHIPIAIAMFVLALWHLLLVNIYML